MSTRPNKNGTALASNRWFTARQSLVWENIEQTRRRFVAHLLTEYYLPKILIIFFAEVSH